MKYLIGEIGVSLLIAGLIGLLIGWMISRLFRSGAAQQATDYYEGALSDREHEIHRLRSELDHRDSAGWRADNEPMTAGQMRTSAGQAPVSASRTNNQSAASGFSARANTTSRAEGTTARPPASRQSGARQSGPGQPAPGQSGTRQPASRESGKYSVAAKDRRGDSASLRMSSDSVSRAVSKAGSQDPGKPRGVRTDAARALDDETYSKIMALAQLGERDRQLQYSYNSGTPNAVASEPTVSKTNINQYQKLLDQKNTQVDDLQRKIRELLDLHKQVQATPAGNSFKEKQLKDNYELESYEKIRAFAGWGEAERELALVQQRTKSQPQTMN